MIRSILIDVIGFGGLAIFLYGVWFEFGIGYAAIIGGALLFACAIMDTRKGKKVDS